MKWYAYLKCSAFRGNHPALGFHKVDNVWTWDDGEVPVSIPWEYGHPVSGRTCAVSNSNGKIHSDDCATQRRGTCETKASGMTYPSGHRHPY